MVKQKIKRVAPFIFAFIALGCESSPTAIHTTDTSNPYVLSAGDTLGEETYNNDLQISGGTTDPLTGNSGATPHIYKIELKEVSTANDMEYVNVENGTNIKLKRGNHEDTVKISREEVIGISSHNTSNTLISRDNLNLFILGMIGIIAIGFVSKIIVGNLYHR
jgi:hypothetical protein